MTDILLALIEREEAKEREDFEESTKDSESTIKFDSTAAVNDEIRPMGFSGTQIYPDSEVMDTYESNPSAFI